eukprot:403364259
MSHSRIFKHLIILIILKLFAVSSQSCTIGNYFDKIQNSCQQCNSQCSSSWCVDSTVNGCIQCQDPTQYKDLLTFDCHTDCPTGTIPMETPNEGFQNGILRYCRTLDYYVDSSLTTSNNIQLGTYDYPFRYFDDAFRESFNQAAHLYPKWTIYLLAGSTNFLYQQINYLLILNSDFTLQPYYKNGTTDLEKQLTPKANVELREQEYIRIPCDFNPVQHSNQSIIPYNEELRYNQGFLLNFEYTGTKWKIHSYRSNILFKAINFTESLHKTPNNENCLIQGHYSPFQWIKFHDCHLALKTGPYFTVTGTNIEMKSSRFDLNIQTVMYLRNYINCDFLYYPGIAGEIIFDGNYIFGDSIPLPYNMIFAIHQTNLRVINNVYKNLQWWSDALSNLYESYNFRCDYPSSREILIQNNTFIQENGISKMNAFYKVALNYVDNQKFKLTFKENRYYNISFKEAGFLNAYNDGGKNLDIEIIDNYFDNVLNLATDAAMFNLWGENIVIRNLTIKNSHISSGALIKCNGGSVSDITLINTVGNDPLYLTNSIISLDSTSDFVIGNIIIQQSQLNRVKVLSLYESNRIDISNFKMFDSSIQNNLIQLTLSNQVTIMDTQIDNVKLSTNTEFGFLNIQSIQPIEIDGTTNTVLVQNYVSQNSEISLFSIEKTVKNGYENKIEIIFNDFHLINTTLKAKQSIVRSLDINNKDLEFSFSECEILNSNIQQGAIFYLNHNSRKFEINNCRFQDNIGQVIELQAADLQDLGNPLAIQIDNSKFLQNQAYSYGIIHQMSNSNLTITESNFEENYSIGRGSVIFGEDAQSNSTIIKSNFTKNYANQGGVMFSQVSNNINAFECIFKNNSAISGGVLYLQNDGSSLFKDCQLEHNFAIEASLFYLFNSQNYLEINGGSIQLNGFPHQDLKSTDYLNEKIDLNLTDYYKEEFLQLLKQEEDTIELLVQNDLQNKNHQIQLVKGTIVISNNLTVTNQETLLSVQSQSKATVSELNYRDTQNMTSYLFQCDQSQLEISNSTFQNASFKEQIFEIQSETILNMKNVSFYHINGPLLSSNNANINMTQCSIQNYSNVDTLKPLAQIVQSDVYIKELLLKNYEADSKNYQNIFSMQTSTLQIENMTASNFSQNIFTLIQTNSNITEAVISNTTNLNDEGLFIKSQESNINISHSNFEKLESSQNAIILVNENSNKIVKYQLSISESKFLSNQATIGSGIVSSFDGNVNVISSTFSNNEAAIDAGAIQLLCQLDNQQGCSYNIQNNIFENNQAMGRGGSIYYDLYSPTNLNSNVFTNNTALYGQDIGSFASEIKLRNVELNWLQLLASGQSITESIIVGIYDQNSQLLTTDSSSECQVTSDDLKISVVGQTKVRALNGICIFNDLLLIAYPDYKSTLKFSSTAISNERVNKLIQKQGSNLNFSTTLSININFRKCVMGEITLDKKCVYCTRGTYSLNPNETSCNSCLESSSCSGGTSIELEKGFWRSSNISTIVYSCSQPESCLGGVGTDCNEGYSGKLCSVCLGKDGDNIYARGSGLSCNKCQPLQVQVLIVIAMVVAISLYLLYILISILSSPKRDKPQTVMIRILTGYFQVIMIVKDFQLYWPAKIEQVLVLGSIVWIIIKLTCKRKSDTFNLKRNIITTCYAVVLLLYPTITSMSFSLYQCFIYEDGNSYLMRSMDIQCWSSDHIQMSTAFAFPFIVIWSILFPTFIYTRLRSIQKDLDSTENLQQYGVFYIGLSDKYCYWEVIVINFKKFLFIIASIFIPQSNQSVKALVGIITLYFQAQLSKSYNPYIDPIFNKLEFHASYASILTLYGGMFFINNEARQNEDLLTALFVFILAYNVYFICLWTISFIACLVRVHKEKLIKIGIFKKILAKVGDYQQNMMSIKLKAQQEEKEQKEIADKLTKKTQIVVQQMSFSHSHDSKDQIIQQNDIKIPMTSQNSMRMMIAAAESIRKKSFLIIDSKYQITSNNGGGSASRQNSKRSQGQSSQKSKLSNQSKQNKESEKIHKIERSQSKNPKNIQSEVIVGQYAKRSLSSRPRKQSEQKRDMGKVIQ